MISSEDIEAFMEEVDKARKPPLTVPEMVEIFAETMRQEKNPAMSWALVTEEFLELQSEVEPEPGWLAIRNKENLLKEMADLVYVLYGFARSLDLPLDEAIRRVHQNNIDRCVWPDGSIKYREDGKVLRNPDAKAIDLSDLV